MDLHTIQPDALELHTTAHIYGMILACVVLAGLSPLFVLFLRRSFEEDSRNSSFRREWKSVCVWIFICLSFGFLVFPPIFGHVHQEHSEHISPGMLSMGGILILVIGFFCYCLHLLAKLLRRREVELLRLQSKLKDDALLSALTSLAAGAAHELCSPLSTIAVVAKELERRMQRIGESEALTDARLIREQVERCREILNDMSSPLRDEAHLPSLISMEQIKKEIEPACFARRPLVRLQWQSNVEHFRLSETLLLRILQNLIDNALDASKDGQEIELSFVSTGPLLEIRVVDQGEGIPHHLSSQATLPFQSSKSSGRGLGLFLVRSLAERFGTGLQIVSHPGRGTAVSLGLYLSESHSSEFLLYEEKNRSYC